MKKRNDWTEKELEMALRLYSEIPFGQYHHSNEKVIKLANVLNRTPSAVSLKLCNFARLDPAHQKRGVKGMVHGSKLDEKVWNALYSKE